MPTIITKTIGPVGRDYATFTAAEAAVAAIPTTDDMVANDEAIVFEVDAGTYNETVTFDSSSPGPGLTMDATRNITYRPAAGSEHGGDKDAGVILDGTSTTPVNLRDSYMVLSGLNIKSQVTAVFLAQAKTGRVLEGLLIGPSTTSGGYTQVSDGADQTVFRNCVFRDTGAWGVNFNPATVNGSNACEFLNCTFSSATTAILDMPTVAASLTVQNCAFLTGAAMSTAPSANTTRTGGGNVTSTALSQTSLLAESQTWTFTSDDTAVATGSQVIYDATNGALVNVPGNDAVGVGTTTGAPTTDINGEDRIRGTFADPGAFVAPLRTITKSIDADGGGDYTTFLAAEAAVGGLPTNGNLVERNEAIVFEAVAGDYSENLSFDTSGGLTSDATRNVTWTHATGAGHGGEFESGVNIVGFCNLREDHAVVDGLSVSPSSGGAAAIFGGPKGVILRNLMVYSTDSYAFRLNEGATAAFPGVVENCVGKSDTDTPFDIRSQGSGVDAHWRVVNCTAMATGIRQGFRVGVSSSDTLHLEIVNNVVLGGTTRSYFEFAGPTVLVTGSANVGPGVADPFPVALQAESQTWTFTTDPQAASTGSRVIYDATNGAMVDAPGNDAWKILTDLSVAPTTDIEGVTREATGYNPGAFERTAADVGTPIGGGVDYLRDLNIRDRFLRGAAIREPFNRNLRD